MYMSLNSEDSFFLGRILSKWVKFSMWNSDYFSAGFFYGSCLGQLPKICLSVSVEQHKPLWLHWHCWGLVSFCHFTPEALRDCSPSAASKCCWSGSREPSHVPSWNGARDRVCPAPRGSYRVRPSGAALAERVACVRNDVWIAVWLYPDPVCSVCPHVLLYE